MNHLRHLVRNLARGFGSIFALPPDFVSASLELDRTMLVVRDLPILGRFDELFAGFVLQDCHSAVLDHAVSVTRYFAVRDYAIFGLFQALGQRIDTGEKDVALSGELADFFHFPVPFPA